MLCNPMTVKWINLGVGSRTVCTVRHHVDTQCSHSLRGKGKGKHCFSFVWAPVRLDRLVIVPGAQIRFINRPGWYHFATPMPPFQRAGAIYSTYGRPPSDIPASFYADPSYEAGRFLSFPSHSCCVQWQRKFLIPTGLCFIQKLKFIFENGFNPTIRTSPTTGILRFRIHL